MLNKSSCFIDSLELVYGVSAREIDRVYRKVAEGSCPESIGYHPAVVNLVLIRAFGACLTPFEPLPCAQGEGPVCGQALDLYFVLDHNCVVQGPFGPGEEEHALAFVDDRIIDPATGEDFVGTPMVRTAWQMVRYRNLPQGFVPR